MAASGQTTSSSQIIGIFSEGFGAGKDSFARTLVTEHGFLLFDFSTVIKEHIWEHLTHKRWPFYSDWFTFCEAHKYDTPNQEGYWVRGLLQSWGQFHRSISIMFWVDLWERRVRELAQRGETKIVVPSVRFANSEGLRIRELGGVTVRVERPGIEPGPDPSENGMRGWVPEFVVQNTGSLGDLASKATWVHNAIDPGWVWCWIDPITLCPPTGIAVTGSLRGLVPTQESLYSPPVAARV